MNDFNLTTRQNQIIKELCNGHSNKQIARILNISEATVKVHLTAMFRKLNVSTRVQAVMKTLHKQQQQEHKQND